MTNSTIENFKTLSELEAYRRQINEALDNRANFISLCNRANELGSRSFLSVKDTFESMAPSLFESKEGKAIMKKYQKTIKESTNLSNLHSLCENIRKANKDIDTNYFVNNIAECNWNVDKKGLADDMEKLGRVLSEAYLFLGSEAESFVVNENKTLSNAIEFIAENERTYKNITEYSTAVKVLKENIEKIDSVGNMFEEKTLENVADKLVLEFNKKYENELTEMEKELVKEISANSNKEAIFEKYKNLCINKINEKKEVSESEGNTEETVRLSEINEQVRKKNFNEERFGDDVCSLVKMISVLG